MIAVCGNQDLLAGLPGASPNVVTQRLRELAASGVVARRELGPPARVHVYELTATPLPGGPVAVRGALDFSRTLAPSGAR